MLTVSDAAKGEVVYVRDENNGYVCASFGGGTIGKLQCTVLRQNVANGITTVGWKSNEITPKLNIAARPPTLTQDEVNKGFILAHEYYSHCEIEKVSSETQATTLKAQLAEKPCRQCRRMNDIGVKKCYLCECPNPTSY